MVSAIVEPSRFICPHLEHARSWSDFTRRPEGIFGFFMAVFPWERHVGQKQPATRRRSNKACRTHVKNQRQLLGDIFAYSPLSVFEIGNALRAYVYFLSERRL